MFFWNSCFFSNPMDIGNLISGSSVFSKCSLNIWKFMVHVLRKPGLENFDHYFASIWDECNCVVVWAFFGIAFLRDWNENWPFSSSVATEFSKFAGILSAALSQHHLLGFEIAQMEFHSTSFVHIVMLPKAHLTFLTLFQSFSYTLEFIILFTILHKFY